ncbi:MAG: hypothetical protein Q4C25_08345 [Bacillota bacterium]|nr:hypothetical protein [Bacillota bacterium]
MNPLIKNSLKNVLVFLITLVICAGTLLLVCQIPQSAIRENSEKSSRYFSDHEAFPLMIGDKVNSRSDNYADCMLFNVIYNMDDDNSFRSIIADSYYGIEGKEASDNFHAAVFDGETPNQEYSRYWHGSQIFIRPLLTFMSIEGIRLVMLGLLLAANLWLAAALLRKKLYAPAAVYFLSLILVGIWMTAFSLEYIMSFLVMTFICIAVVRITDPRPPRKNRPPEDALSPFSPFELSIRSRRLTFAFIAGGALTSFLDFLTTETITFTVPVILLLMICKSSDLLPSFRVALKTIVKWGFAWLLSYAAMFAVKWALVYAVLGKSAFLNALQNAALRIEGAVTVDGLGLGETATLWQKLTGVLLRNLSCLFPVGTDVTAGMVIGLTLGSLALLGAIFYLFRKEKVDGRFIGLALLVGLIPYLRFLCLSNHSYIHYFFTYRAQMATVMALAAILIFSLSTEILSKSSGSGSKSWKGHPAPAGKGVRGKVGKADKGVSGTSRKSAKGKKKGKGGKK